MYDIKYEQSPFKKILINSVEGNKHCFLWSKKPESAELTLSLVLHNHCP